MRVKRRLRSITWVQPAEPISLCLILTGNYARKIPYREDWQWWMPWMRRCPWKVCAVCIRFSTLKQEKSQTGRFMKAHLCRVKRKTSPLGNNCRRESIVLSCRFVTVTARKSAMRTIRWILCCSHWQMRVRLCLWKPSSMKRILSSMQLIRHFSTSALPCRMPMSWQMFSDKREGWRAVSCHWAIRFSVWSILIAKSMETGLPCSLPL